MLKIKAVLVCLILAISLPAHSEEYFVTPTKRIVTKLNVRDTPKGVVIGEISKGEFATLLAKESFWYRVKLKNGTEGYVAKGYSKLVPKSVNPELRITYMHTGAGTCAVVKCPDANKAIIMDCGSWPGDGDTNFHRTEAEIGAAIKSIVADAELSAVFSHGDTDHYNYAPIALANLKLKEIWLGGFSSFYTQKKFPEWLAAQESHGAHIHKDLDVNYHTQTNNPESHLSCGAADVFILSNRTKGNVEPNKNHRNRNSLVTLVEYNDFRAIFTGDAEKATEKRIVDNYPNITANVVTGSHHGAKTHGSNHQKWVDQLTANAVVYTSGFKHAHPKCDSTRRFKKYLAKTGEHDFTCDASASKEIGKSSFAEYGTEALGDITVISRGISPFKVECSRENCASIISH